MVEGAAFGVETACHPHRRIGIEKTLSFAGQPLRAADQQVGVRQRKEIRALPHVAGVRQAVHIVPGDLPYQAPLSQVAGGKQQHFAALLHILRPKNHVPCLLYTSQALLDKLNIRLTADRLVGDLSIAAQQMVEIAKAVSWNADIVIMDEPTSALTEGEVAHLFTIIRDLLSLIHI